MLGDLPTPLVRRRMAPRWALVLALALLAATAVLIGTRASAAEESLFRSVPLNPGYNQIVYVGPTVPTQMALDQVPALQEILRWDASRQRYEGFSKRLPLSLNGLSSIHNGDVLWVRLREAAVWTMPILTDGGEQTLVAGWNIVGWQATEATSPQAALSDLASRLESAYVLNPTTGEFDVYSRALPESLNTLTAIRPNDAVWLRISQGAPISWSTSRSSGGAVALAQADSAAPLARDSREVERAIVHVQTPERGGSGFIVSDSQILTSAHIVDDFTVVTLHFYDGRRGRGEVSAVDVELDIAVIQVEEMTAGVRRLDWESAGRPQLTDAVWVWGFPFESNVVGAGFALSVSVTGGFVSAWRTRDDLAYVQTDAAVNPGNSGGPLTTLDGRVIGIVTSVFTINGRDAEGLNFAVSVTEHRDRLRELLAS